MAKLIFRSMVLGTLMFNLEVQALTDRDLKLLENCQNRLLGRYMGRSAYVWKDASTVHHPLSAAELRRAAGIHSLISTLRVRRILWFRSQVRFEFVEGKPRQTLAALLGRFPWQMPFIDFEGRVLGHAPRILKWLAADLCILIPGFVFAGNWRARIRNLDEKKVKGLLSFEDPRPVEVSAAPTESQTAATPHATVQSFVCPVPGCDYESPYARAIPLHRVRVHGFRLDRSLVCGLCGANFTSASAKQWHEKKQACFKPKSVSRTSSALQGMYAGLALRGSSATSSAPPPPQQAQAPVTCQRSQSACSDEPQRPRPLPHHQLQRAFQQSISLAPSPPTTAIATTSPENTEARLNSMCASPSPPESHARVSDSRSSSVNQ